jgi:small GTP-binding protein
MTNEAVPVVAVVGRPNVGKSTLVNRILGSRQAVVEDKPGVTRDRVAYDALWNGRAFTLVDTGGWEPSVEGSETLAARVAAQARVAVDAADAVLFVVDATVGVTDADAAVARVLRRSGKPVVVAANKVDDTKAEPEVAALWSLGLGEPAPVSALHGRGSGDLLDLVLDALPDAPQANEAEEGPRRVALLGRPNVGKSSLLNTLAGHQRSLVDPVAGTTRDPVDELVELGGTTWRFVDTAGIRRRFKENQGADYYAALRTAGALDRAEVAVVLVDASDPLTEQDLRIISEHLGRHRAAHRPAGPGAGQGPGRVGNPGADRQAERVADRPGRGDPAAGARRAPAQDPVRHPGRRPSAALRPVHLGLPRGGLPPVRGTAAARGVRLRRQPGSGLGPGQGQARRPFRPSPHRCGPPALRR